MKKLLLILLIFVLALSGCEKEEEIPLPPSPVPEKDWQPQENTPDVEEETWYSCNFRSTVYDTFYWDHDNNIVFQSGLSLLTVSPENEIIGEITLKEQPSCDSTPVIIECGNYILALHRNEDYSVNSCVYYTYSGKLFLSGTAVYDREGNLLYEFEGASYVWKNGKNDLPHPKGDIVMKSDPSESYNFIPFGDSKAYVVLNNSIGIYDFEAQKGEILWKGDEEGEKLEVGEMGIGTPYLFNGKLWFTGFYYDENGEEVCDIWTLDETGAKTFGSGAIAYAKDSFVVFTRDGGIYCINLEGEILKMGTDGDFSGNVCVNGSRIGYQKRTFAGEETVFFSYNTSIKRSSTLFGGFTADAKLLGSRTDNGRLDYYYVVYRGNSGTLWKYDGEKGYNLKLFENLERFDGQILSRSCELLCEVKTENEEYFIRVLKIDDPAENSPLPEDEVSEVVNLLTEEDFLKIYRPNLKLDEEEIKDLTEEEILEKEKELFESYKTEYAEDFNRAYNFALQCFSASVSELNGKIQSGEIEGESYYSEDGKTAIYALCDSGDYALSRDYIWINLETGERKLIYWGAFINEVFEPNTLILHNSGSLSIFDIRTGKPIKNPPKFDFGYYSEDGFRNSLLGICYDRAEKVYIAAYYERLTADNETGLAELKLSVFDREGEPVKTLSTGEEVLIRERSSSIYAESSYCPYPGVVSFRFYGGRDGNSSNITVNYKDAEPEEEKTGLEALWSKFAGSWFNDEKHFEVRFFAKDGEYLFTIIKGQEVLTAKANAFEQLYENAEYYKITAGKENGEVITLFVFAENYGENKMRIFLNTEDPVEYVLSD